MLIFNVQNSHYSLSVFLAHVLVISTIINNVTESANILSVSFFSSRSHNIVFEPLLVKLVEHGHNLTIISSREYTIFNDMEKSNGENREKSSNNYSRNGLVRQIIGKSMEDYGSINFIQSRVDQDYLAEPNFFATILEPLCKSYLEMEQVQNLLNDNNNSKFDLIIASAMMNECSLGYISQFNTSFILTIPFSALGVTASIFGAPSPTSFVPIPIFSSSTHVMNIWERVQNMIISTILPLSFHLYMYPKVERVYRNVLGHDVPSVVDIQKNASLILMNSHFSLNYPRPVLPDMIEVGGMHCRPGKQLPKELAKFLDESAPHGFIYLSFGSVIKSIDLPDKYLKIFLNVFSKLNQRVLWKWENTTLKDVSANVKLSPWIPQQDVLAHSNIRLFITHGGLLSTQEAVYHGVPLVGLPIFADQDWNMAQSEQSGFAITLNFRTLTEESLTDAIHRVLLEKSFSAEVNRISKAFKDRPEHPLDTALYWTEYVIRNSGAPLLRSPARNLSWLQYYSIDVIFIIVLITFSLIFFLCKISTFIIRNISRVLVRIIYNFDLDSCCVNYGEKKLN